MPYVLSSCLSSPIGPFSVYRVTPDRNHIHTIRFQRFHTITAVHEKRKIAIFPVINMAACDRDRLNVFYPTGYPDRTENIHFLLSRNGPHRGTRILFNYLSCLRFAFPWHGSCLRSLREIHGRSGQENMLAKVERKLIHYQSYCNNRGVSLSRLLPVIEVTLWRSA